MADTANTFESLQPHFKELYAEKVKDLIPEGTICYPEVKVLT